MSNIVMMLKKAEEAKRMLPKLIFDLRIKEELFYINKRSKRKTRIKKIYKKVYISEAKEQSKMKAQQMRSSFVNCKIWATLTNRDSKDKIRKKTQENRAIRLVLVFQCSQ